MKIEIVFKQKMSDLINYLQSCCCRSEEQRIQDQINRAISKDLRKHKRASKKEIKLLLLGTGEAGKSTFIKQMRILHGSGFSQEERFNMRHLIYQNIVTNLQAMVKFALLNNYDLVQSHNASDLILKAPEEPRKSRISVLNLGYTRNFKNVNYIENSDYTKSSKVSSVNNASNKSELDINVAVNQQRGSIIDIANSRSWAGMIRIYYLVPMIQCIMSILVIDVNDMEK